MNSTYTNVEEAFIITAIHCSVKANIYETDPIAKRWHFNYNGAPWYAAGRPRSKQIYQCRL